MYCNQCGNLCGQSDRFCGQCGNSLSSPTGGHTSTTGDQSFNAGQNNVITGNHISLGGAHTEPTAYIDRSKVKPLEVAGHPVKVAWFITSGVFGLVGSVATIWGAWPQTHPYLWFFVLGVSGASLAVGGILHRLRFVRLPFGNLESNRDGHVFHTEIAGACPKCDGSLKLREVGPEKNRVTIVRCSRNPDHWWRFDPTVLGDIPPR